MKRIDKLYWLAYFASRHDLPKVNEYLLELGANGNEAHGITESVFSGLPLCSPDMIVYRDQLTRNIECQEQTGLTSYKPKGEQDRLVTPTPYSLVLYQEDIVACLMFGHAYETCRVLAPLGEGSHALAEHQAWEIAEAFKADTEDLRTNHPVISMDLELRLVELVDSIV